MQWHAVPALLSEFHDFIRLGKARRPDIDAVIGWGAKPTSHKARAYAHQHELPYIAIEDGFLRSYGLGVEKEQPHSIVVDRTGIYYDATRPSDLEILIRNARFSAQDLARARHAMARLHQHHLSKYNSAPDRLPRGVTAGAHQVLVVDQTRDDVSVTLGHGSQAVFEDMLKSACAQHPDAEILVKVHPDVASGHRRGYLSEVSLPERCRRIDESTNPWPLLEQVDAVHVVSSQLGFEALMAGCQVHCHGMPFYAGWGLTHDRLECERRNQPRQLEQLFAAAYLSYSRYYNPYTGQPSSLEATIDLLSDQKRQSERLAGHWVIHGVSGWKRRFLHQFLGPKAQVRYLKASSRPIQLEQHERLLLWGYKDTEQTQAACQQYDITPYRMEDGFVRSSGLGADLVRPLSLVIDKTGLYYDPSTQSDLEIILNTHDFPQDLLERAERLRQQLIALKLSKYNLPGTALPDIKHKAQGREIILVPGQVDNDASVLRGSPLVKGNSELVRRVREQNPTAFILYKPHPDVTSGGRLGALNADDHQYYDMDVSGVSITELLDAVDVVHTMSSLTGFEALLRGVRVHAWGSPFYAGWGLTEDETSLPRRTRRLELNELVAAVLVLYPIYIAPTGRHFSNIETVIALLHASRHPTAVSRLRTRLWRMYRRVAEEKY